MQAFNEISFYDFKNKRDAQIINEIESSGKEYILGVNEEEYINYLQEKYRVEPLQILTETESIEKPVKSKETIRNEAYTRGYYETEVYTFTVKYNYKGSGELFRVQPDSWIMRSYEIQINEMHRTVSFSFKLYQQDPEEYKKIKDECYRNAFANFQNINSNVEALNNNLKESIKIAFLRIKEKYLKENNFFTAINLKVDKNTSSVFTAPTIKKKEIPRPRVSDTIEFSSEPTMNNELYNDILKVIYDFGKSMERKPSTYVGKDEEALRDQFLLILETRYEETTATGETFNREGKTDIILKYSRDGSNLFVAECKYWHGPEEFLKAISQLFDRYLSWRDSKVALMLFVTNKDFTSVIDSAKEKIKNHQYYISEKGERRETSFSYIFRLPQDKDKKVFFEIILFHFDK